MNLKFFPLIVFTLKFTRKNQQIGKVYTNMLQMYRCGKNTNDNLNTHDFEYYGSAKCKSPEMYVTLEMIN